MPHSHCHDVTASNPRLGLSIALTLAFVAGEAVAGYFSHSLALMSDAGHNFSDALALMLSWYGFQAAQRPASSDADFRFSSGWHPRRTGKRPDARCHRGHHHLGSDRTPARPATRSERPHDLGGTRRHAA